MKVKSVLGRNKAGSPVQTELTDVLLGFAHFLLTNARSGLPCPFARHEGTRGFASFILNLEIMNLNGLFYAPAVLPPFTEPQYLLNRGLVDPKPVWTFWRRQTLGPPVVKQQFFVRPTHVVISNSLCSLNAMKVFIPRGMTGTLIDA
jgi:hypothetical protein